VISGRVDAEGIPVIEIEIGNRNWRAVIDTGFNGDLELPSALKDVVHARFIGRIHSLLGGGQTLEEDSYLVRLPFDGVDVTADATFVEQNELLIGTHLLRNHRLEVDFPSSTVSLERIDSTP